MDSIRIARRIVRLARALVAAADPGMQEEVDKFAKAHGAHVERIDKENDNVAWNITLKIPSLGDRTFTVTYTPWNDGPSENSQFHVTSGACHEEYRKTMKDALQVIVDCIDTHGTFQL